MEEPFLPWWLALLLGMWAIALTVWQHPSTHREVRLWAGLSTLVYFGLIFLALGVNPRTGSSSPSNSTSHGLSMIGFFVCVAISLAAGVWMLGRISTESRRLGYVVLTLANSGTCLLIHAREIACGLMIVALLSAWTLFQGWLRTPSTLRREWLSKLYQFTPVNVPRKDASEFWLIGGLTGLIACTLLGTVSYALRNETSRVTPNPRATALPSRIELGRLHASPISSTDQPDLFDYAFGPRADVVILLAVIVFLCLAISLTDLANQKNSRPDSVEEASLETSSEGVL